MTKNRIFQVAIFLLIQSIHFFVYAQDVSVSLNVANAGSLKSLIYPVDKNLITDLTLTGSLNGTDIVFLNEMATTLYGGNLSKLNLSDVKIVKGGIAYSNWDIEATYTSDDTIGNHMFHGCDKLQSLILPTRTKLIGNCAFMGCGNLTTISIPRYVTSIGINPFNYCYKLQSINVANENNNFLSIDGVLFNKDKTEIIRFPDAKSNYYIIPDSVTRIGSSAFYDCKTLINVVLPNSVISIGRQSFSDTNIKSITIPKNVMDIGDFAFSGCFFLSEIRCLTAQPPYINSYSFQNVDKKTCKLYIPAGTTPLYKSSYWSNFTNIIEEISISINIQIPGTISTLINANKKNLITDLTLTGYLNGTDINFLREMVGRNKQGNITDGKVITLDISKAHIISGGDVYFGLLHTTNDSIGESMFLDCTGLKNIRMPESTSYIGPNAFNNCINLTNIEIPVNLSSIGKYAFQGCTGFHSITIPKSIKTIDEYAFSNCTGLDSLNITSDFQASVNRFSFTNCNNLTSVTFGRNILDISNEAFTGCNKLERFVVDNDNSSYCSQDGILFNKNKTQLISFPCGNKMQQYNILNSVSTIDKNAFYNCTGLKSITIPDCVTSIKELAFYNCTGLSAIHANSRNPIQVNNNVFNNVDKANCKLYVPRGSYSPYWIATGWGDFANIFEEEIFSNITTNQKSEIVYSEQSEIVVKGNIIGSKIKIYSFMGQLIHSNLASKTEIRFKVKNGQSYIVRVADKNFKVSL